MRIRLVALVVTVLCLVIAGSIVFSFTGSSSPVPTVKAPVRLNLEKMTESVNRLLKELPDILMANRINIYLSKRGALCAGYGRVFVDAGKRTGVNPLLVIGISGSESTVFTNGNLIHSNYNGMGMRGNQPQINIQAGENGYCSWNSWEEAINGYFDFIDSYWADAQRPEDCHGYCASGTGVGTNWNRTASAVMEEI